MMDPQMMMMMGMDPRLMAMMVTLVFCWNFYIIRALTINSINYHIEIGSIHVDGLLRRAWRGLF
jgi:hypothetical protein